LVYIEITGETFAIQLIELCFLRYAAFLGPRTT